MHLLMYVCVWLFSVRMCILYLYIIFIFPLFSVYSLYLYATLFLYEYHTSIQCLEFLCFWWAFHWEQVKIYVFVYSSLLFCITVAPRWLSEPQDLNVSRGSESRFDCVGHGIPTPKVSWAKLIGSLEISKKKNFHRCFHFTSLQNLCKGFYVQDYHLDRDFVHCIVRVY